MKFYKVKKNQNRFQPIDLGLVRFNYFISKTKTQPISFDLVWFDFDSIRLFYIKNKKNIILGFFELFDGFQYRFGFFGFVYF